MRQVFGVLAVHLCLKFSLLTVAFLRFLMVGFCAAAMSATPFLLFEKGEQGIGFCLFAGLLAFFAYNFERKRPVRVLVAAIAAVFAGLLLLKNDWPVWPDLAFSTAVAAAYFLPKKGNALRDFTFFKPISVATVWAVLSIKMPLESIGQPFIFALFTERFCFVAALAVGWDLVDFEKDASENLATLPVRFGVSAARKIAFFLLVMAAFCSFWLFEMGIYESKILVAVLFSFAVSAFVLEKKLVSKKVESSKIWLDSMMILQAAAVLVAQILPF